MKSNKTSAQYVLLRAVVLMMSIFIALPAQLPAASMGDYCIMPPYVKTNVKPNILIMMDNAVEMNNQANTLAYVKTTTYSGYFKPSLKYTYSSNRWVPDVNGIYSGNLLNWATTSKYDLLQNILVGGISTSRQTNVNTLVSKSNSWTKTLTYVDSLGQSRKCIFNVNNGNVEVTDSTDDTGTCGYLDGPSSPSPYNTPHPIPGDPDPVITSMGSHARFAEYRQDQNISAPEPSRGSTTHSPGFWSTFLSSVMDFLVPSAEAASPLSISGGPSVLPNGTECTAYSVSISASGGSGSGYDWSIISGSMPGGLTLASGTPSATISGTPTVASATYTFTVQVVDSAYATSTGAEKAKHIDTKQYTITLANATVAITSVSPLQEGYVNAYYEVPLTASGACKSSFTWSVSSGSLPPGFTLNVWSATVTKLYSSNPTTANTYNFTLQVTDAQANTATKAFTLVIHPNPGVFAITSGSPLNSGTVGSSYFIYIESLNGIANPFPPPGGYSWSIISGSLPPGLTLSSSTNYFTSISGTPTVSSPTINDYTFRIRVVDFMGQTAEKEFHLTINSVPMGFRSTGNRNVNICTGNYTHNCTTALPAPPPATTEDDWRAAGCSESDLTRCVLKSGLIDEFWTQARFGLTDFNKNAGEAVPNLSNCIETCTGLPEDDPDYCPLPDSNFLTAVENAVAIDPTTTLVNGEYAAINYFKTNTDSNCNPYIGATTCTKSFVLLVTSGVGADNPPNVPAPYIASSLTANVFGTSPDTNTDVPAVCNSATLAPLAKNACYGNNHGDLRADVSGTQTVGTYVVNTMGTPVSIGYDSNNAPVTTGDMLKQAAVKGGGVYYEVTDPAALKAQLQQALQDIIKRAAAGTAASVLASGEGSGANLIQAVFYPRRKFGDTEISWIGRLTNLWYYVDPRFANSTIREDDGDKVLNLKNDAGHHDYITSLYFNGEATMATRWTDTNGDGGVDGPALSPDIQFENVGNLWEAGTLLWKRTSLRTILTSTNGTSLTDFSTGNRTELRTYLQANSDSESEAIIRYVHGEDTPFSPVIDPAFTPTYRPRSVKIDVNGDDDYLDAIDLNGDGDTTDAGEPAAESVARVWKLGDVLNSTPKISTWLPLNVYHKVNRDATYGVPGEDPLQSAPSDTNHFITTSAYKSRGMIFAGANDGMLHAFKLGTLELKWTGQGESEKARLTGSDLGKEMWAFIPKNVLPYLKYTTESGYCHIYSVDLSPYIFDASIGAPESGETADSPKTVASWRTILIGGMRYGGACKPVDANCATNTPDGVCAPDASGGYSSYFALDVTDQNSNPVLLWERSSAELPGLGFTTGGPAVVRISALTAGAPDNTKNGKWFVVFGSGPTGPINTTNNQNQFMGHSDQPLKLFVLNLKDGTLAATPPIPSGGIANAFAGSLFNATMDTDNPVDYQDDVVYIPYVKKCTSTTCTADTWTDGGVLRLSTREDQDATHWSVSTVMGGIGPVTSAVTKLQNNTTHTLWVYFGTGRYYYALNNSLDDAAGQRQIFGVKEPCFSISGFNPDSAACTSVSGLTDVTDIDNVPTNPDDLSFKGWSISLDADGDPDATLRAERVITDPLATTTGVVFFTTYKPYRDACALGGKSFIWAVKYNSGGAAGTLLKGKALVQVSTGSIEQINLADAFTDEDKRKSAGMEGVPPTAQGLSVLTTPAPVKRVLHRRER